MKVRYVIGITVAALLAGAAGVILSAGLGDPTYLAGTSVGRWLGVREPTANPGNGVTPARDGEFVGPLQLVDLDGRPQSLPVGRRVLINVWASWCVPCRQEMPLLSRYAASQDSAGVAVFGLAEDDDASVGDFLQTTTVSYPILLDDGQWRAGTRLGNGVGVLPFTALLDADGRLVKHRTGSFDSVETLRHWVDGKN